MTSCPAAARSPDPLFLPRPARARAGRDAKRNEAKRNEMHGGSAMTTTAEMPADAGVPAGDSDVRCKRAGCGRLLPPGVQGRPRQFCSKECRIRHYNARRGQAAAPAAESAESADAAWEAADAADASRDAALARAEAAENQARDLRSQAGDLASQVTATLARAEAAERDAAQAGDARDAAVHERAERRALTDKLIAAVPAQARSRPTPEKQS